MFRRKCIFCGLKEGCIKRVVKRWAYESIKHSYHEDCFKKVICNPEDNEKMVDTALEIDEILSIEREKQRNKKEFKNRKLTYAQEYHCDK